MCAQNHNTGLEHRMPDVQKKCQNLKSKRCHKENEVLAYSCGDTQILTLRSGSAYKQSNGNGSWSQISRKKDTAQDP